MLLLLIVGSVGGDILFDVSSSLVGGSDCLGYVDIC